LQRCAHAGGGILGELQPGALDDQIVVGTREVVFDAGTRGGELLELLLGIDRLQMGGETAQPPVAQQRLGQRLVFVALGSLPQLLRQFRRTGFGDAGGDSLTCQGPGPARAGAPAP
jgi:hypothetical protein